MLALNGDLDLSQFYQAGYHVKSSKITNAELIKDDYAYDAFLNKLAMDVEHGSKK